MTVLRKTYLPNLSIDDLRTQGSTILENTRSSSAISSALATRGWDDARLDALQARFDDFNAAAHRYSVVHGQEAQASNDLQAGADAFRRGTFRSHTTFANAIFRDDADVRGALRLDQGVDRLDESFSSWQPKARDFYQTLLSTPDVQQRLADFNVTLEELEAGRDELARLKGLYDRRAELQSERQQLRRDRDAKRAAFENDVDQLRDFASAIFADQPDRLERLGFTATGG